MDPCWCFRFLLVIDMLSLRTVGSWVTRSPRRPRCLPEVRVFPKGNVVISKRDLGVSHIPGSQWSWAPDGNEVGGRRTPGTGGP